ncbi:hypothetical protein KDM41_02655 [bacterium]|nr:hypothetical protein [bacterium]
MKTRLMFLTLLALLACAGTAGATIDWAGNVWPLHNSSHVSSAGIDVYAQVYKGGTTDAAGQGADIWAELYYASSTDGIYHIVLMTYNGDIGNNDEYTGTIPQSALIGADYVDSYVIFHDDTDGSNLWITGDQSGNPPPLRYNVVEVLPVDVTVQFTLCMSGTETIGAPCVIGSAAEIGSWGTGVTMNSLGGEVWEVFVVFPAGSSPSFDYKYKKDDCTNWESVGNRTVTLPTDGTSSVELAMDGWDGATPTCDPVGAEDEAWGTVKSLYR